MVQLFQLYCLKTLLILMMKISNLTILHATSPESRSPIFQGNYPNGTGFYMSNGFLDMLNAGDAEAPYVETGIADPRLRYYYLPSKR